MPPFLDGHFAPHAVWGFKRREREFFDVLQEHHVKLVCCAHGLAFDTHAHEGIRFVMSGAVGADSALTIEASAPRDLGIQKTGAACSMRS